MTNAVPFQPAWGLRSTIAQSILASKRPVRRFWRKRGVDLEALSSHHIFDVVDDHGLPAKITGYFTPAAEAKALVVLIHGWEGSHESNYLYGMSCTLHVAGYALFRLNMRDHGDTHALNEGLFHSARLAEILHAIQSAQKLAPQLPLFVIGFSLGGNFALRVALHGKNYGLAPRLCIGISPAVNPHSTLKGIDEGPALFNKYFLSKWRKTMDAKSVAWPGRYDFSKQKKIRNFVEITRAFVEEHTEFATLEQYLGVYTLTPDILMASPLPIAIFTAEDDSVCPPADFAGLKVGGNVLAYQATKRGGHCGFISNWRLESWAEARVVELLNAQL